MRNSVVGKLRRLRCDNDGDNREALPRSAPSALVGQSGSEVAFCLLHLLWIDDEHQIKKSDGREC
jgi:hypothetical protein